MIPRRVLLRAAGAVAIAALMLLIPGTPTGASADQPGAPRALHPTDRPTGAAPLSGEDQRRAGTALPPPLPPPTPSPTWSRVPNLTTAPSPRSNAMMTYDTERQAVILFGGIDNATYYNDTWEFANGTWSNITAQVGPAPPARASGILVDVAELGYLVLWGGASSVDYTDTWIFNATGWHDDTGYAEADGSPPACYLCSAAYGPNGGNALLFDGYSTAPTVETWFFGGRWQEINSTGAGTPNVTEAGGMDYDSFLGQNYYYDDFPNTFGQDGIWVYYAGTWTSLGAVPTPARAWPGFVFYGMDNYSLLFGGSSYSVHAPFQLNDTWSYENSTWTNLTSEVGAAPSARWGMGMAYDAHAGYVVLFGGAVEYSVNAVTGYVGGYVNDTWTFGVYNTTHAPAPEVSASANRSATDVGLPIRFIATPGVYGTPPFSYSWSFGDGTGASGLWANHSFAAPGTYAVRVTITDAHGERGNASVTEQVQPDPSVGAYIVPGPFTDVGQTVFFNGSSNGGIPPYRWHWSFGDGGFASLENATHAYSTTGLFPALCTITDALGVQGTTGLLLEKVAALPSVNLTASPLVTDAGRPVTFAAVGTLGSSPYLYAWDLSDGATATGPGATFVHAFSSAGTFTVNLTLLDAAGANATATVTEHVNRALTAAATVAAKLPGSIPGISARAIVSTPFLYHAAAVGGTGPFSYTWSFGDGATSTAAQATYTFATKGNWTASVLITDAVGASAKAFVNVTVTATPTGPGQMPHGPSNASTGASGLVAYLPYLLAGAVVVAAVAGLVLVRRRGSGRSGDAEPLTPADGSEPEDGDSPGD
jgi:chitodextrinase